MHQHLVRFLKHNDAQKCKGKIIKIQQSKSPTEKRKKLQTQIQNKQCYDKIIKNDSDGKLNDALVDNQPKAGIYKKYQSYSNDYFSEINQQKKARIISARFQFDKQSTKKLIKNMKTAPTEPLSQKLRENSKESRKILKKFFTGNSESTKKNCEKNQQIEFLQSRLKNTLVSSTKIFKKAKNAQRLYRYEDCKWNSLGRKKRMYTSNFDFKNNQIQNEKHKIFKNNKTLRTMNYHVDGQKYLIDKIANRKYIDEICFMDRKLKKGKNQLNANLQKIVALQNLIRQQRIKQLLEQKIYIYLLHKLNSNILKDRN